MLGFWLRVILSVGMYEDCKYSVKIYICIIETRYQVFCCAQCEITPNTPERKFEGEGIVTLQDVWVMLVIALCAASI